MLKTIRVAIATLSLVACTLLFVDFTGTAQALWPWLAKAQFIPAVLSANILAFVLIIGATLLLGRVYCSVICPLGILQDVVNWLRGHVGAKKKRRNRFRYTPAWRRTRLGVLTVFAVLLILGLTSVLATAIAGLIEPYSAFGRIASQIFAPAWDGANNLLASWSESRDNYMFYRVTCAVSVPILAVAIVTLVAIVITSWRHGRLYCNSVCPVGTILGVLSKFSLLRISIDTTKCINCGKCARNCKAGCINAKAHAVDYTRCVACMDCINECSEGAIGYTLRRRNRHAETAPVTEAKPDADAVKSRRGFISAGALLVGAAAMHAAIKTDGGLTPLKAKRPAHRDVRVAPAGAQSLKHLGQHCTGCQLCIQSCPHDVLKPNMSIDGFMQPTLDFTHDYCHPDCTVCSNVCPVGAMHPVDEAEKSSIAVGAAVVNLEACVSASGQAQCGSCARHCPAGAIQMIPVAEGSETLMPVVNKSVCIGCGSCEYHCPAGTVASMTSEGSAIHVEGLERHRTI